MTVEFSNTKASVWNSIQTALTEAGFIVANVSALDKKQGSFKAVTTPTAVKQDLVISAYKPNGGFEERFQKEAQTEEGVWDFVRTHLKYLPVTKQQGALLQFVPERDPRILFDQMVAYYVRKGYPVPISSQEFQIGLAQRFSERMSRVRANEIRELLKLLDQPDILSFAGGIPDPGLFPSERIQASYQAILADPELSQQALQYSVSEGYLPLREWVAKRYETMGVYGVTADDIIITNGSQQVLTMIGACMLDPGDKIIVENPTYLVALQSFHFFDPEVLPVTINPDGIDCDELAATVQANPDVKFAYVIPNFQNPTGLSYSKEVHDRVVEIFKGTDIVVLEDNPYRELRFSGTATDSFGKELGEQCCMLGTFSKIVAPGMRIGWVCVRNKAGAPSAMPST